MERRYGWRDIAALLGVYALVLQIGLGVVAGLASESIASERRAAGDSIADLALQICSPSGLLDLARDGVDKRLPGATVRSAPPVWSAMPVRSRPRRRSPPCPSRYASSRPSPPPTATGRHPST
ncbi:MAG: hypothetical protein ACMVO3_01600 [Thalassobaculum sp.]